MQNIIETLSPIEIKIIPFLKESIEKIEEKSGLDNVSVLRALRFLENKGLVKVKTSSKIIVDLGTNGIYYEKNHLPERKLLLTLEEKNYLPLEEARKLSKLSDNEFKVSIGVLKDKALIELSNGKLVLKAAKEELIKKMPEEHLLEMLPCEKDKLKDEMLLALENLKKRKEEQIAFVESQGVQVPPQLTSNTVYLPLFISSLVGDKGVRYNVYPPMIAKSGKGVIGGIQSMFGGLVLPLEPKTKQFDEVFRTGIEHALADDRSLATYIGSVSMSANILYKRDLPEMLVRGLAEMKNQGWIKDKHEKELLQSLQKHISMASSTAPPK